MLNGFNGVTYPWSTGGGIQNFEAGLFGSGRFVSTSARAPEVGALLGLARTANALYLKVGPGLDPNFTAERDVIDVDTSATNLYRMVEASIRRADCLLDKPSDPTCAIT